MASRVAQRGGGSHSIDLPTGLHPQYVNQEGYEVSAETFASAMGYEAQSRSRVDDGDGKDVAAAEAGDNMEVDEEGVGPGTSQEEAQEEAEAELAEPLLSLSERYVPFLTPSPCRLGSRPPVWHKNPSLTSPV